MVTVSTVNEDRLKKKRYQEIYQVYLLQYFFILGS
jgi:hypothetical protein